jgi:Ca2+-binding RTX toxin-like protein
MLLFWIRKFLKRKPRPASRTSPKQFNKGSFVPSVEVLADRLMPSITAFFAPQAHVLTVLGDAGDNRITIGRDAAGDIQVNGGTVRVFGGAPTVANTAAISVFGLCGNDTITMDETNGRLPSGFLFGGDGNDTLVGGSATDFLFGQAGNDVLFGMEGNDFLFGGDGNDMLVGGAGNDQVFGQAGNDVMVWNPGDGTDLNEGGAGNDTVIVNGGNASESFTIAANGSRVRFDRVDPAPFSIDIGTSEHLVLNANGGDDVITAGNGLAPLISLTLNGGDGNDTITGGDGNDLLIGGAGNDVIVGGRGNDTVLMGAGDDTFIWNPGDGSDTVDGQEGQDAMVFNGANIDEKVDMSANGSHLRFTRDVGNIVMDVNGTERVDFNAFGGADTITVNDLTGTDVTEVNLSLERKPGSGEGDGALDTVIVNGTAGNDAMTVNGDASGVTVTGLAAQIHIVGSEPTDKLVINAKAGDDVITATGLQAGTIQVTANGEEGNDVLIGSPGNDVLNGGAGDDTLIAGSAQNILDGGPGDNTLIQ